MPLFRPWLSPFALALSLMGVASGCGLDQPAVIGQGGGGNTAPERALVFEPNSPLQLDPGKSAILAVRLTPPRAVPLRFGIVGDSGNSAYLSTEQVTSDAEGRAFVTLFAPKLPGAFRVRAATELISDDESDGGPLSAERSILISASGFGAVVITLEGASDFAVAEWRASAFPGTTCAKLGTGVGTGSTETIGPAPLLLADLPAGGPLAIVVTGGLIARGCATVPNLNRDEVEPVTVSLEALPFEISGKLDLELSFESVSEPFTEKLRSFVEAEFNESASGEVLLNAMKKLVPEDARSAFAEKSKEAELVQVLQSHFEDHGGLAGVFALELAELARTVPTKAGLVGRIDLSANPTSLHSVSISGVPAETILAKNPMALSFEVDFDGKFVSSSLLRLSPLAWLRDLGFLEASESETRLATHLAQSAGCGELAIDAVSAFSEGEAYPECGRSCLEELCANSLEQLWETLGSKNPTITLDLAQSGALERDDRGNVTGITGEFLAVESGEAMLEGSIRAIESTP